MCQMQNTIVRIAQGGRLVIPAAYRKALGLEIGDEVILGLADGELRIYTRERAIRRLQEMVGRYVADDVSLADELISERRAESARE